MAITTYATLQTALIAWAMRSGDAEFAAQAPDFITGAEHLINYGNGEDIPALRVRDMETSATVTLTSGAGSLPSDYLQWREVRTNSSGTDAVTLTPIPPDYGTAEYAGASATTYPKYFDIVGSTIATYPQSSANLTLKYYAKVPALSDSQTTNWLLTKAPMVYLYGGLIHAAPYVMDDARTATWGALYKAMIKGLTSADTMSRYARSGVVLRGVTP